MDPTSRGTKEVDIRHREKSGVGPGGKGKNTLARRAPCEIPGCLAAAPSR